MELSERMTKARSNKGLTVQAVSEAVHVDRETVSAWEAGTATPDANEVARLCQALHVSADDLLFEKPPVPPTTPPTGLIFGDIFWAAVLANIVEIIVILYIFFA